MTRIKDKVEDSADSVLGHVIPRRRFTRWAAYYFLLYFCLPLAVLALLGDLLLYAVFFGLYGRCYALSCLFG